MKKILFGFLLFIPLMGFASPGSWIPTGKTIKSMIVDSNSKGVVLVILNDGGVPSGYLPEVCNSGTNSTYNTIDLTTEKGKAMYSMALAAYMSSKPIKLALSCTGNRPLITHMWVLN